MARENIRFQEGNFTGDGTYYYSILDGAQALQQKVDDGTVAFTYPLDTAVAGNINGLEWDGVYFWSVENRSGGDGITIRRWGIESFICKQQQKFEFIDGPTHTYNVNSLAIEHYRLTVDVNINGGNEYTDPHTTGLANINISDTSMLDPGDVLTFVRKFTSAAQRVGTPFVEQGTVQSVIDAKEVVLTAAMSGDPHGDGKGFRGPNLDADMVDDGSTLTPNEPPTPDEVFVTKFIWFANDDSPGNPGTPSLYKVRASNGTNVIQYSGTQYNDVNALTFYTKYNVLRGLDETSKTAPVVPEDPLVVGELGGLTPYHTTVEVDSLLGGRQTYLLVARDSSLLFFNTDTALIDRSMVMNNIKVDTINHWNVDDMLVIGIEPDIILYRLQLGTTYKNPSLVLTDASWSQFNYEKQLLRRVVSSISVSVFPSIIPADGNSTAVASATVRDQYNDVVVGKAVEWASDAAAQPSPDPSNTDAFGVARTIYTAGVTEQDVKITASIVNGLV